jgi:hypothetical protein
LGIAHVYELCAFLRTAINVNKIMEDKISDFKVNNKKDFDIFLDLLRDDLKNNPENWENNTLESFLEALQAYTNCIQNYYDNFNIEINSEKASWQVFADIFKGAIVYE